MLGRDQQLRTQIYQLVDAVLFALALWLGHLFRFTWPAGFLWWHWQPIDSFDHFKWFLLLIVPGAPIVLEAQGFYRRPLSCRRATTAWILFKSCLLITIGVILVMFLFKMFTLARAVPILFGVIAFITVFLKEELLRWGYKSKFAQSQLKRRVILVGARGDTSRMRDDLNQNGADNMEVAAELDLNESTIGQLVKLLHERSANSVIINAKHTYFGQVEKAIQTCELEGVEAWLVVDFFQTQLSRTSFDNLYGRPVLVFRTSNRPSTWLGLSGSSSSCLQSSWARFWRSALPRRARFCFGNRGVALTASLLPCSSSVPWSPTLSNASTSWPRSMKWEVRSSKSPRTRGSHPSDVFCANTASTSSPSFLTCSGAR